MQNAGEGWLHKHIVLFRMLQFKTGIWEVKSIEEEGSDSWNRTGNGSEEP